MPAVRLSRTRTVSLPPRITQMLVGRNLLEPCTGVYLPTRKSTFGAIVNAIAEFDRGLARDLVLKNGP